MAKIKESDNIAFAFADLFREKDKSHNPAILDGKDILWKFINGKWVGKRSVFTRENSVEWLENTTPEKIKWWTCGVDADYNETFNRSWLK